MTEWENLFETSKLWPDVRKPTEHILDSVDGHNFVRGEFHHWLEEAERIGDEMNAKLKAIETWMEENWSAMNSVYNLDLATHKHPRWELKEILQGSTPTARSKT